MVVASTLTTIMAAAALQPNFVFVHVDDWGYYNVGFRGNPFAKTPTLDALAEGGVILDRYYTYKYCSPTRRSFLSGRFPPHSGEDNSAASTIDYRMATIADKLSAVGYATHQVGKWHAGHFSVLQTPAQRGFDTSLGYFNGAEDHWLQIDAEDGCGNVTDFWDTDAPAFDLNGTLYGDEHFAERAVEVVRGDTPFFLYLALQCAHEPMEAPERFVEIHEDSPAPYEYAMVSVVDQVVENLTVALEDSWNATLMVVASDNGGPAFSDQMLASNYPLRAGKYSVFEGGIRVNAFVTGGFLPPAMRGTRLRDPIHVCDWYATFVSLAGGSPADDAPGVPPIDSIDQWPLISANQSTAADSREIFLATGVLLVGDWKLIATSVGKQGSNPEGKWSGPLYPAVPAVGPDTVNCSASYPCLYNVVADPRERTNMAPYRPDILADMLPRLWALYPTVFEGQPPTNLTKADVCAASAKMGGYLTPADYVAPFAFSFKEEEEEEVVVVDY
ncbi:hypothetical protein CTAYLR_006743 [Chrysophaeum taylorii]|uniref:Sulfatase N-terminal domain-containing protein n=1 Tax=Chrysophaeum taylorii TaxID=2483200 RepID=A0AAD7UCF7_9STRA|nr:hypothetical protein CTAYLR_006743 [Chrysophaeum taylorii]